MSILEKIKNGFNRFWNEDLGPDIDDENENDFPEDVKTVKEQENNIKKQNAATETTRGRKPKQVDDSEIIH